MHNDARLEQLNKNRSVIQYTTLLASVECACRARHAQLQKTHLRHAQKKRKKKEGKKKKKKKKKKSEFGHAMCPNSDTPCSEISFLICSIAHHANLICMHLCACAGMCRLCDDSSQYGLRSHMLLPKYRSGNPLSSNFHDFLK